MDKYWIKNFSNLMFGDGYTIDTMSRANHIKFENMPNLLFKYRPICNSGNDTSRYLDALENDYLYASIPLKFNDIFECPIDFDCATLSGDVIKGVICILERKLNIRIKLDNYDYPSLIKCLKQHSTNTGDTFIRTIVENSIREYILSQRNRYSIICLSETYDHELMWAHYADSNKGFCIGYNFRQLGCENELVQCLLPVEYSDSTYFETNYISDDVGSRSMHALTIKSTAWKYEEEWRLFHYGSLNRDSVKVDVPKASVVYAGASMEAKWYIKLMEICIRRNITLYKMGVDVKHHRLTPVLVFKATD